MRSKIGILLESRTVQSSKILRTNREKSGLLEKCGRAKGLADKKHSKIGLLIEDQTGSC